ncbi:MAG: Ig-like domain-containing protein, partial [Gammaproteobacteria bacterium]|nr:Ig-like domain-containing protein [Gammaproteobacteria bacterium]
TANLTVTAATLDQIEVTPGIVTIAEGSSAFLHANGIFSDQTTQDLTSQVSWQSSDTSTAEVNSSGQVTGLDDGSVTITASMDGKIATTTVTVTDATLTSLSITPGSASITLGAQYQFTASGHYSDGSIQDLTQQVSWSVLNNSIMDFVNGLAGSIQGKAVGSTTLTASLNGTSSQILVNITAAVINKLEISSTNISIALGSNLPLQATAIYSDASSQLVTNQTIWLSSEPDFATIDSNGVVQSHSPGTTTITALHNGISSSLTVSVSNAILSRIEITPLVQSLPAGISQAFFATGIYSDNSVQDLTQLVTWSSTNTGIASIDNSSDNKGLCTAISVVQTTISADLGSISGSKLLTITNAVLTSIEISPGSSVISKGLSQTYNAIGHFSDGSINDVTNQAVWSTSNTSIANSVANQTSVILSYNSGNVTVSANIGGIYGFTSLTINDAVLTSITIDQLDITIAKGTTFQFT